MKCSFNMVCFSVLNHLAALIDFLTSLVVSQSLLSGFRSDSVNPFNRMTSREELMTSWASDLVSWWSVSSHTDCISLHGVTWKVITKRITWGVTRCQWWKVTKYFYEITFVVFVLYLSIFSWSCYVCVYIWHDIYLFVVAASHFLLFF